MNAFRELVRRDLMVAWTEGGTVGVALGFIATRGVLQIEAVKSFLEPRYSVDIFVRAIVIAVGVALVGTLYPAYRAVRLSPMEALRHE